MERRSLLIIFLPNRCPYGTRTHHHIS